MQMEDDHQREEPGCHCQGCMFSLLFWRMFRCECPQHCPTVHSPFTFLDVHVICKFLICHRDVKAFKELNMNKKSNNY